MADCCGLRRAGCAGIGEERRSETGPPLSLQEAALLRMRPKRFYLLHQLLQRVHVLLARYSRIRFRSAPGANRLLKGGQQPGGIELGERGLCFAIRYAGDRHILQRSWRSQPLHQSDHWRAAILPSQGQLRLRITPILNEQRKAKRKS